jgi:F0F1-type ATP synthase assembly protein I
MTSSSRVAMGSGWYGVAVTDESRPSPSAAPTPRAAPKSSRFFSSVDASMLGLGSQMFSEVAAGVLLGFGLDYMLGTHNRWIVVGSLAGVAVAMVSVIRVAVRPQTPRRRSPSVADPTRHSREQEGKDLEVEPDPGAASQSSHPRATNGPYPTNDPPEAPRP